MDYKNFKKVASDKNSTTLKHPNGHTIKIAHGGLSPKMRQDLAKLPMAAGGDAFNNNAVQAETTSVPAMQQAASSSKSKAKGGQVKRYAEGTDDAGNDAPLSHDQLQSLIDKIPDADQGTQDQGVPVPAEYTPGVSPAGPQATVGNNPNNPTPVAAAPTPTSTADDTTQDSDDTTPDDDADAALANRGMTNETAGNTPGNQAALAPGQQQQMPQQPVAPPPPTPQEMTRAELLNEDADWQKYMASGAIHPKTYSDLFAKNPDGSDRGTLSKIGLMFGVMLGGMGSGLTHQPSAIMGMMNNEIANDLNAQKETKSNAMNLYKLNLQHQLQKATIGRMGVENALTAAQTGEAGARQGLIGAQTGEMGARQGLTTAQTSEAVLKAKALSNMQANRVALSDLVAKTQNMPEGPGKQQAQQALVLMSKGIDNENYSIADRAAAASAMANPDTFGGSGAGAAGSQASEQTFTNQQNALRMGGYGELAKSNEEHHLPYVAGKAITPITDKDRHEFAARQNLMQKTQALRSWAQQNQGSLNPAVIAEGKTKASLLQDAYRQVNGEGVFRKGENDFITSFIDSNPTKFLNQWRVDPKMRALEQSIQTDINSTLNKYGFNATTTPEQAGAKIQAPMKPQEGATGIHNNRPVVRRNGKWEYK